MLYHCCCHLLDTFKLRQAYMSELSFEYNLIDIVDADMEMEAQAPIGRSTRAKAKREGVSIHMSGALPKLSSLNIPCHWLPGIMVWRAYCDYNVEKYEKVSQANWSIREAQKVTNPISNTKSIRKNVRKTWAHVKDMVSTTWQAHM